MPTVDTGLLVRADQHIVALVENKIHKGSFVSPTTDTVTRSVYNFTVDGKCPLGIPRLVTLTVEGKCSGVSDVRTNRRP